MGKLCGFLGPMVVELAKYRVLLWEFISATVLHIYGKTNANACGILVYERKALDTEMGYLANSKTKTSCGKIISIHL